MTDVKDYLKQPDELRSTVKGSLMGFAVGAMIGFARGGSVIVYGLFGMLAGGAINHFILKK